MDHKLNNQILKVAELYKVCTNKAIKQSIGRIMAGDTRRVHRTPQRAASR